MELLIIILLIVIALLLLIPSLSKGEQGERKVRSKLAKLVKSNKDIYVFNDLTLETPDGTTQIDHIVLSRNGIFVIETKNLKGWIFGSEKRKQWTQTLYRKKYRFQNPMHQNYKHVKAVQNLLGIRQNLIFSVVVFVGKSQFKTVTPYNVLTLRELLPYLRSHDTVVMSDEDIEVFAQKLSNPVYSDATVQKEHLNNVYNNLQNPVCPKCGKQMVLRTAQKGKSIGSQFWGCSGFPSCKYTKRMA